MKQLVRTILLSFLMSAYMAGFSFAGNVYQSITDSMSDYEYELLAQILALEAQGEPLEGQIAVVEVIFNRVLSDDYPDTIEGVLSQKGEFASWKYLDDPYNTPVKRQYEAIDHVIENGPTKLDTGYLYFSTSKMPYGKDYIKIEHHYFGKAK